MGSPIIELTSADFSRCGAIWDIAGQPELAACFRHELEAGIRRTWLWTEAGRDVAEISLVYDMNDAEYTVPGKRAYVSHLVVAPAYRRQGIGRLLLQHVCGMSRSLGYTELSVGVDLDNYPALRLYVSEGFDRILRVDRDEGGVYAKLLRQL